MDATFMLPEKTLHQDQRFATKVSSTCRASVPASRGSAVNMDATITTGPGWFCAACDNRGVPEPK